MFGMRLAQCVGEIRILDGFLAYSQQFMDEQMNIWDKEMTKNKNKNLC